LCCCGSVAKSWRGSGEDEVGREVEISAQTAFVMFSSSPDRLLVSPLVIRRSGFSSIVRAIAMFSGSCLVSVNAPLASWFVVYLALSEDDSGACSSSVRRRAGGIQQLMPDFISGCELLRIVNSGCWVDCVLWFIIPRVGRI
jgi:hypothetical protein